MSTHAGDTAFPPRRIVRRFFAIVAASLFLGYAVAAHWAAVSGRDPFWAIAFLIGGIGIAVVLNAHSHGAVFAGSFAILLAAMLYWRPVWMIYLPPTVLDLMVAWFFARSLVGGRMPLIEQYMRVVHPEPPPRLVRHAQLMTWIWAGTMTGIGVLAAALALLHYALAWSMLVNVVSYLVMVALFIAEYLYRRLSFPPQYHTSPLGVLRVVQKSRLMRFGSLGARPRL